MIDLIAVTIGALTFLAWTGLMIAAGWYGQQRRNRKQWVAMAQRIGEAARATQQTPVTNGRSIPPEHVRKSAQA